MAYNPVTFLPGVFTDVTEFTAEGRWHRSNRIRFRDGLPEVIGGWIRRNETALNGVPRALHAWGAIDGTRNLAIGTSSKLLVQQGGSDFNITPIRDSGTLGTDPFTTTISSAVVSVADTAHGLEEGATVSFSGATAVGGITIDGEYTVTAVTSADAYTITHSAAATSGATGGGAAVDYSYEINVGQSNSVGGFGFGASTFGAETWGTPRSTTQVTLDLRLWSLINWGEDLLANPRGDKLYFWDESAGTGTRATVVAASPTADYYIVSPDDEHVIALGAGGDPLRVQWCDQSDFTNWTASSATTAGSRTLRYGSKIIGARVTRNLILIWTDKAVFSMRYVGTPFTFEIRTVALRGVALGPFAATEYGDAVYWMGDGNFYRYDGRVSHVPCTVLRYVFDDLDYEQRSKIHCGVNEAHQEIWWFYPSASGSGENDLYVKYDVREQLWDVGVLPRTAWIDRGVFDGPIAADASGYLYDHESGYTDNGVALGEFLVSGEFDIAESDRIMFLRRFIPDILITSGTVLLTFFGRKYPNQEQISKGPFMVDSTTKFVPPRLRARRVSMRMGDSTAGTFWRGGRPMADTIAKGRR